MQIGFTPLQAVCTTATHTVRIYTSQRSNLESIFRIDFCFSVDSVQLYFNHLSCEPGGPLLEVDCFTYWLLPWSLSLSVSLPLPLSLTLSSFLLCSDFFFVCCFLPISLFLYARIIHSNFHTRASAHTHACTRSSVYTSVIWYEKLAVKGTSHFVNTTLEFEFNLHPNIEYRFRQSNYLWWIIRLLLLQYLL